MNPQFETYTTLRSRFNAYASHLTSRILHISHHVDPRVARWGALATYRVLVVDNDASNQGMIADILADEALTVTQVDTTDKALRLAERDHPDVVIIDLVPPRSEGKALAHAIKARWPDIATLAISAEWAALPSLADGDFDAALANPFEIDELADVVRKLCPVGWTTAAFVDAQCVA